MTPCLHSYSDDGGGGWADVLGVASVPPSWCSGGRAPLAGRFAGSRLGGAAISAWGFPEHPKGDLRL